MDAQKRVKSHWVMIPVYGTCVFIVLYFIATLLYPGGSQADKAANGFSWLNNYWCDLLDEKAKNGATNNARIIAVVAWCIVCLSLSVFWYFIPLLFSEDTRLTKLVRYSGSTAMFIAIPLFTPLHDWVIQVAGLFGLVALLASFTGLYKNRLFDLFYSGLCCFVLMMFNYIIMMSGVFREYLPLIQKITFVIVLAWMLSINRRLIRLLEGGDKRRFY